jgi:hypothetical protein
LKTQTSSHSQTPHSRAQLCRPGVHLGKRDRPDGRVLMPPRKRYEFGGDDDPGFDPG